MTWSIGLQNGDLALGVQSLGTVTGEQKLVQDLRCFILEAMGTDPVHPDYGSLILGGVDGGGVIHQSMLSQLNTQASSSLVEAEISRICTAYQAMQLARAKSDQQVYGKSTFSRGEVLISVNSISSQSVGVNLIVTVNITTANNSTVTLNVPISTTS